MIFLTSPSKTMELGGRQDGRWPDEDRQHKAMHLRDKLQQMNHDELKEVYGASDQVVAEAQKLLADPGYYRALPGYAGLIFKELDYASLRPDQCAYLDAHLWILSALYGYLRPTERFAPYRLDLVDDMDLNLVDYWRDTIRDALPKEDFIVNLASKEYMKLIDREQVGDRLITIDIKERREDGKLRTVATYAKKARGAFLRFAAMTKPTTVDNLKHFDGLGYVFSEEDSTDRTLTFIR